MSEARAKDASRPVSHVVLFRPRADISVAERAALIEALRKAVDGIPFIRKATIGKRVLLNRPGYETQMAEHYEYSAILDFDSKADLRAYLDHAAHDNLGRLLFTAAGSVLAYDFEHVDVDSLV